MGDQKSKGQQSLEEKTLLLPKNLGELSGW
jgi:hypothetical protein